MSLVTIEKSRNSGSPIELYKFFSDSFAAPYHYTSSGYSHTYLSQTYIPVAGLKRSTIEIAKDAEANSISVSMDGNNELAKRYIKYLPPKAVWLHIYRKHELDPDTQTVLYWQGKVNSVSHDETTATFNCIPIYTALAKNGLEYNFGNTCQHMFGDTGCKVNLSTYTFNATVLNISGDIITASAFAQFPDTSPVPAGYWTTGFVTRSNGDIKYVVGHATEITGGTYTLSDIQILTPFEDLAIGEVITITAGCNHAYSTCVAKFNNIVNYFGFNFNGDNPFTKRIDL